jgi:putative addiction module CopG family antidote
MNITVTPKAEKLIRQKIANGSYQNPGEVVEAAMVLLDERDRLEHLRSLLREAEQEFAEGKVVAWTPDLHRQWRRETEDLVQQGIPTDPDVWP